MTGKNSDKRSSEIERILDELKKKKFELYKGSDDRLKLVRLSTGIDQFDKILGGGIPQKRTIIFTGEFSTGKTYLAQKIIQSVQSLGGIAAFIDAEKTFDKEWFKKTGVNVGDLIVAQPNLGDEAIDIVVELLKNNIGVVVLDSIAALIPPEEAEESAGKMQIGMQARLVNKALRKITSCYTINNTSVFIAINQLRADISPGYGLKETLPGGHGQEFFASAIVKVGREGWINDASDDKKKIGFNIRCYLRKSKISVPYQTCVIPFLFTTGQIDYSSMAMQLAIDERIIEQKGHTYYYNNQKIGIGKGSVLDYLNENKDILEEIKKKIYG